ncbi:MAG TPA: type II secretion system protein [Patescibacteria group bacterium]|nr:type II secretion system protein [Patescibacteria group bacterium]
MNKSALPTGFTLIELLIVVSIIAVLTGSILPSFNTYITNQNLRQAQEQVKNDMKSTQIKALAGAFSDDSNVKFWGIKLSTNNGTYDFFTSVSTSWCTQAYNGTTFAFRSTSTPLPNDLRFKGAATRCVYFNLDNGDITNINPIIVGAATATSNCRRVEMNGAGRVIINLSSTSCT